MCTSTKKYGSTVGTATNSQKHLKYQWRNYDDKECDTSSKPIVEW